MDAELSVVENLRKKAGDKANMVKWGLGLAAVIIVAPVTYLLAYALFGLALAGIALGCAGAVGLGLVWYAPVFSMKMKNRALMAIETEARKNPIVTALSVYYARETALETSKQEIENFGTEVEVANGLLKDHSRKYPEDIDAISDMQRMQDMSNQLLEKQGRDYQAAKASQAELWKTIERLRSRYQTSLAALRAKNAGKMNTGDVYETLKLDTSYQSVMRTSAEAFSQLRSSLLDSDISAARNTSPRLAMDLDKAEMIHVLDVQIKEPIPVQQKGA